MVKLAAKCVLAGESGPPGPIRPSGGGGLERAPWGGARPAAGRRWDARAPSAWGEPRVDGGRPRREAAWLLSAPCQRVPPDGEEVGNEVAWLRWGPQRPGDGNGGDHCSLLPTPYPVPLLTYGESRAASRVGVKRSWTGWNASIGSKRKPKETKKKSISTVRKGSLRMG